MATFASDDFTETDGTELSAHTPSGGGSWTRVVGSGSNDAIIYSDSLTPSGTAVYYHSGSPATAEYDVSFTYLTVPGSVLLGIAGRIDTGSSTGTYYLVWAASTYRKLYKSVSGSFTELAGDTTSIVTDVPVKLEIRDASKKIYVDGTEVLSSIDNAITAAGKAGIRSFGGSTGVRIDNFLAADPAAGAAASLTMRRASRAQQHLLVR